MYSKVLALSDYTVEIGHTQWVMIILHTTTDVVGLNFQPVDDEGQNFQLAAMRAYNFQLNFQPAKNGKLKTRLKNMLWLNFRPFIRSCECCTTRSVIISAIHPHLY